jgi:general secretion pathway protein G
VAIPAISPPRSGKAEIPDNFCIARCFLGRKGFRSNPSESFMKYQSVIRRRSSAGFTLLEMVIVLGIIALILGGSITFMGKISESAKVSRVDGDFSTISSGLKMYKVNNGAYPSTQQGLKALVEKPSGTPAPRRWSRIMDKVPPDPWGNEYGYKFPGSKDSSEFEIISKGADGIEGGETDYSSQDAK